MRIWWWGSLVQAAVLAAVLAACKGSEGTSATEVGTLQGVSTVVRAVSGERLPDAEVAGGGSVSQPNAAGNLVFDDQLPGMVGVTAEAPGYVRSGTGAPVQLDRLTAAEMWLAPADVVEGAATTAVGGAILELPDGALVDSLEQPYDGPWQLSWLQTEGDERWSSPGESTLLYEDVLEAPLQPVHPTYLQGESDDGRLRIEGLAPLSMQLPAGSPVQTGWRVYHYSFSAHRWTRGELVGVDPQGVLHTEVRNFGWIGFALEELPPSGCVTGAVVLPDGSPADGAEVRLLEPGVVAATRGYVEGGRFCVPLTAGATAEVEVLWFDKTFTRIGRTSDSLTHGGTEGADCGGACFDVGTLSLETGNDADGDFYFGGPGGDCDDGDPDVNPSVVYGDGSWCGP